MALWKASSVLPLMVIMCDVVWWALNYMYNLYFRLVVLEETLTSSSCIQNIVQPILLPFLQQEGDVFF